MNVVDQKLELRARVRARLTNLPPERWAEGSSAACARLAALSLFQQARVVMLYLPMPREVDVSVLAVEASRTGKGLCIPRWDGTDVAMRAVELPAWSEAYWERVPGSVLPRALGTLPIVSESRIDLIVIPGLAFDERCGRLGRGRGFYDRFLVAPQVVGARVGIALDEQLVDAVPREKWDVSMHAVVTDTRTAWNRWMA